jgi:hypothetical protein
MVQDMRAAPRQQSGLLSTWLVRPAPSGRATLIFVLLVAFSGQLLWLVRLINQLEGMLSFVLT